jgi:ABC-type uncharacterized transport system permease subunit
MDFLTVLQILDSTVRLATPLLLACLAGLYSERAGIFDIGLEGKMLAAAFFSAAIAFTSGSVWIGLFAGSQPRSSSRPARCGVDHVPGQSADLGRGDQLPRCGPDRRDRADMVPAGRSHAALTGDARFENIVLPGAESTIREIQQQGPLGQIYSELISGHSILVYIALLIVPLTWWVLFRTRFGLRLRAVGENPAAVDTAGVSVVGLRYAAVAICGVLCGLAGAYLATALNAGFVKDMSAGRGFIALAALIFAKWRPWYALSACLLFGLFDAVGNRFQNIQVGEFVVPVQFMQALPYILVVIVLAGLVGKAIPPRAGGEPYVKER